VEQQSQVLAMPRGRPRATIRWSSSTTRLGYLIQVFLVLDTSSFNRALFMLKNATCFYRPNLYPCEIQKLGSDVLVWAQ